MSHRQAALAALAAAVLSAVPRPSLAQGSRAPEGLRVAPALDGVITALALGAWGASELAKDALAPAACGWCTPPGLDRDARAALAWSRPGAARSLSNVLVLSIPAGFGVYDLLSAHDRGGARATAEDLLVVAEAVAVTGALTQLVKLAVARQRPYATGAAFADTDARLSFWSSHAAVAFAAAASGGTVARLRGYAGWPWVYGAGFAVAAATAYLRVAADQHWLTDVVAGAVVGTAIGFALPWLHRDGAAGGASLGVIPGGLSVSGRF
jgi:membrane-associated phospholipid phosphatase